MAGVITCRHEFAGKSSVGMSRVGQCLVRMLCDGMTSSAISAWEKPRKAWFSQCCASNYSTVDKYYMYLSFSVVDDRTRNALPLLPVLKLVINVVHLFVYFPTFHKCYLNIVLLYDVNDCYMLTQFICLIITFLFFVMLACSFMQRSIKVASALVYFLVLTNTANANVDVILVSVSNYNTWQLTVPVSAKDKR